MDLLIRRLAWIKTEISKLNGSDQDWHLHLPIKDYCGLIGDNATHKRSAICIAHRGRIYLYPILDEDLIEDEQHEVENEKPRN